MHSNYKPNGTLDRTTNARISYEKLLTCHEGIQNEHLFLIFRLEGKDLVLTCVGILKELIPVRTG